jgi:hypothetical protein
VSSRKREGNRPGQRIAPFDNSQDGDATRRRLKEVLRYTGSAEHKLHPGNYGFTPSPNPHPSKSVCDDLRPLGLEEARALFEQGIEFGMFSFVEKQSVPKYVWSVDAAGEVYEAKCKPGQETDYHGYRLGDDERARRGYVLGEWKSRCGKS